MEPKQRKKSSFNPAVQEHKYAWLLLTLFQMLCVFLACTAKALSGRQKNLLTRTLCFSSFSLDVLCDSRLTQPVLRDLTERLMCLGKTFFPPESWHCLYEALFCSHICMLWEIPYVVRLMPLRALLDPPEELVLSGLKIQPEPVTHHFTAPHSFIYTSIFSFFLAWCWNGQYSHTHTHT